MKAVYRLEPLFKKKDLIVISLLLIAAALFYVVPKMTRSDGSKAVVIYDGNEIMRIPLDQDGIYTAEGDLKATFEVKEGKIRFIHSLCPDKLCEGFGWISLKGETAVCMPAKLALIIVD